jgi:hypothetical protein
MSTPEELAQHYPLDAWLADFDYWVPKGVLSSADVLPVVSYFHKKYPENPLGAEMASRFWNSLMFLETLIPQLAEARLLTRESDGSVSFPTPFQSAFYRATFSWPEAAWRSRIDVALLAKITKDQKDWNEDRT